MKTLIVVRHGNTFSPDEEPRRIGGRTDLPLVEESRSISAACVIRSRCLFPDRVFAAPLLRTMQTARLIVRELDLSCEIQSSEEFTEIDYGEDEGQTESEVIKRLGKFYLGEDAELELVKRRGVEAIEQWNLDAIPPAGWRVDVKKIIASWRYFAESISENETVLVVSSNGIIRFSPYILLKEDFESFSRTNNLKVTTGGICIFVQKNKTWTISDWNIRPDYKT
ncbi:MAG: histidine phosphatase family protein [Planctomycetaceae bacterium]|jgi:probable phosphoglycerate mutase|nr:histidine phosphatase family protein [Planctomycetaceae bacterium]